MSKPFKSLDEQLKHLEDKKKIKFEDRESAKEFLLNNNYLNVISSTKILFYKTFNENGEHVYQESNFNDWITAYNQNLEISYFLLKHVQLFEKKINARLAYYLSYLIDIEYFDISEMIQINNFIYSCKRDDKLYVFDETWCEVNNLMFQQSIKLFNVLNKINKNRQRNNIGNTELHSCLTSIANFDVKDLHEINNLRNQLAHNTPLYIYLTSNRNLTAFNQRKKAIQTIINISSDSFMESSVNIMLNYAERYILDYIEAKNS